MESRLSACVCMSWCHTFTCEAMELVCSVAGDGLHAGTGTVGIGGLVSHSSTLGSVSKLLTVCGVAEMGTLGCMPCTIFVVMVGKAGVCDIAVGSSACLVCWRASR